MQLYRDIQICYLKMVNMCYCLWLNILLFVKVVLSRNCVVPNYFDSKKVYFVMRTGRQTVARLLHTLLE